METTELLSPRETATRLHVTYGTLSVWRCTHRKALPFVKIGRKIFYRPQDIERFITDNLYPGNGERSAKQRR